MMNKLKENFISSAIYLPFIFIADVIVYLLFLFIAEANDNQKLPLIACIFISNIFLSYRLGERRIKEINSIKDIIRSIRKDEVKTSEEIHLAGHLKELETEIKKMYGRTQDDIASMKKLELARTEFLGNVSHELRTPIFAIQGYIETLLNGAINDNSVNLGFLEKAAHHTHNLNNLLNDLIDISMIESGQMKMSFRYFPIAEYLEGLVKDFTPMAEEKGLKMLLRPVKKDLMLFGDKERLRQVFVNLLTNAIKYTENGTVELIIEEVEKGARIIIKDTGSGIPEEDLPRIFERFYRVDKVRSRQVGGTGLGLAIVKHIVEAHGSKVRVSSKTGIGSEFSFLLKK